MPSPRTGSPLHVESTPQAGQGARTSWCRQLLRAVVLCVNAGLLLGMADCDKSHTAATTATPTASLSDLTLSGGLLNPPFSADSTTYSTMFIATNSVTITPTAPAGSTITVNGTPVASGAASAPIALPSGESTITLVVSAPNSSSQTYIITANQLGQDAFAKASNTDSSDQFGLSVALSGDTLAVGASSEDSNATGIDGNQADNSASGSGAVYVFTRNGGVWTQQAYVKASNAQANDQFGYSVALSGDTLAVGAISEDSNATGIDGNQADNSTSGSGAVYVFTRNGGVWTQQAYVKASNAQASDQFGVSVALSGDTLAVGASSEDSTATGIDGNQADNSASGSGAVYVFTRNGGVWSQQAYVKASNAQASDQFGYSVELSGDTLAVGAYGEDSNATGIDGNQADNSASASGAVYVFARNGGVWSQQAYVKASNAQAGDQFGVSVALSGDTLAVGAISEDSNATGIDGNQADNSASGSGAVYVFARNGGVWTQQAYVKASNAQASDQFGHSVALSGDTLAVGAISEDSNATGIDGNQPDNTAAQSGAVYVFTRNGGVWTQQAYVKASNAQAGDQFGYSVELSGDTLAVSAWQEDSNATGINGDQADNSAGASGAVYILR